MANASSLSIVIAYYWIVINDIKINTCDYPAATQSGPVHFVLNLKGNPGCSIADGVKSETIIYLIIIVIEVYRVQITNNDTIQNKNKTYNAYRTLISQGFNLYHRTCFVECKTCFVECERWR